MATSSNVNSAPPYPDIFTGDCNISSDDVKYDVLTKEWNTIHSYNFPIRLISKSTRKAKASWFIDNKWLKYSEKGDSVYCAPYRFLGPQSGMSKEKTFGISPVTDWSNIAKLIQRHVVLKSHESSLSTAEDFIRVMEGKTKNVKRQVSSHHDKIVTKNRHILGIIIETIILCGNQNLALRGHEEDKSNFIALLKDRSQDNQLLRKHLESKSANSSDSKGNETKESKANTTTYLSPDIQNEIIEICGDIISNEIVQACNSTPYFGFIADEATDVATIEQMALCLRFYDENECRIREEFIGFAECKATTGEALTDSFLENLRQKGVDVEKMRGQGYDGAANMAGKYRGVQARIRNVVPGAIYTHCKAHNLNLSIIHACKEPLVRNVMNTLQEIAFVFDYSAKKLNIFKEQLAEDAVARTNMEGRQKLKTLCETRWASRSEALYTFKAAFSTAHATLGKLSTDHSDPKAGAFQAAIERFDFIVTLVAAEHALSGLVPLSNLLQKKECDLYVAVEESRVVTRQLNSERNDPEVWNALYNSAVELAATIGVLPSMPRNRANQRNRPNAPADNPSDYWKLNMYLPFVDHLMTELDTRLLTAEPRYKAQYLLPKKAADLTQILVNEIYDTYQDEVTITRDEFHAEIRRWRTKWTGHENPPNDLQGTLHSTNKDLYPGLFMILNIFACMPVSTATAKRSFSTMRRVKTYLRSTMTTSRMSGLGLLNIYREREIAADNVLDIFSRKKERKWALIFEN